MLENHRTEKVLTRVAACHLSQKKRKELIETMKRRGYVFCGIQYPFYIFETEAPQVGNMFGLLTLFRG